MSVVGLLHVGIYYSLLFLVHFLAGLRSGALPYCFICVTLQYEAALAVDAVSLVSRALSKMMQRNPDVFRNTLKNGKVYNNGTTEGIDCDAEPVVPWKHGYDIMKTMREVSSCFLNHVLRHQLDD